MHVDISFKKCTKIDIESLVTISQQFYPEHYAHIWKNNDPSFYINLSFNKDVFEKDLKIENINYFLIQKEDSNLGLLKIRKNESVNNFSSTEAMQLEKIYLLKKATGLGIGKKGLEFTKKYALSLDKKVLWLDVMTTSPALTFYQKNGFTTTSFYDLDYPGLKDGYREMQRMIMPLP
ncbi:GNAT family N-acetyltransferase [Aquimarina mytili]|uniref:GNAT family N-acetyltransferase n=1 Tax=Aquimarina mytili TaxID=874423 RepID=A0A936ZZQ5_9FLAO|nr:GNAT family N-acetyltransferase [Aquimarina mytili]MBL0684136.1 GNAT family N-acetyltransferase [Aquimarina mytili]